MQGVIREAVSVVIRLVLLLLDHQGHVALAGAGLRLVRWFLDHGVEGRVGVGVGVVVWAAQEGPIMAGRGQDGDIIAERDEDQASVGFNLKSLKIASI